MCIIPVGTDAPIYHRPYGTIAIVLANVLVFTSELSDPYQFETWKLTFDGAYHPMQWVTYNFIHFGPGHLVGNLIFLVAFGIGIEGKLGWMKFVALYLLIGVLGGISIQWWMIDYVGPLKGAGGASLAISGLMAMSIIWAPLNEVHCIWIYFNRVIDFQVSNLWFCGLYIARDLFWTVGSDFTMGGPFGHSVGAIIGAGIAALLLKHRLVDCENWDIVSVAKGIHVKDTLTDNTPPHLEKLKEKESPPVAQSSESSQKGQRRFDRAVANQDWENALACYWYLEKIDKTDSVTVPQFRSLAHSLFRIGEFREAAKFFEKLLAKDPRPRPTEVLKLAAILLDVEHRPRAALRSLQHIERHRLDATQIAKRNQIAEIAEMQVESGNLEMAHRV